MNTTSNTLKRYYPLTFLGPAVLIYGLFFLLPTLMGFVLAFTDWTIYSEKIHFIGFENFFYFFKNKHILTSISNTLLFAVLTTFFKLSIGLVLALALNEQLKAKHFYRTIFFLPAILSYIVVGLIFTTVFKMEGLLNDLLSFLSIYQVEIDWLGHRSLVIYSVIIMEIWKWSGFCMVIFLAGLQGVSKDTLEAVKLDGATYFQKVRYVIVPLIMPSITVNVVINIIGGLKVFEQVFILTGGGPGYSSEVVNTMVFRLFSQGIYGRGSALGLLLVTVIAAISFSTTAYLRNKEVQL